MGGLWNWIKANPRRTGVWVIAIVSLLVAGGWGAFGTEEFQELILKALPVIFGALG